MKLHDLSLTGRRSRGVLHSVCEMCFLLYCAERFFHRTLQQNASDIIMLRITLLGQFRVEKDGQSVEISSRHAQSLLAFLGLSAGTRHQRAKLAGLFWPDSTESNALSNLRHTLWRLRKAIGSEYLLADNQVIAFDPEADHWLDAAVLHQRLTEDATLDDLIASVSAYSGELLPGYYDDWIILERERLQGIYDRKMKRLLDLLVDERRWADVLLWAERWIAFGQVPEPAYRALMVAHSGRARS
jgi:DNA-binding SARP family transcriptional activator